MHAAARRAHQVAHSEVGESGRKRGVGSISLARVTLFTGGGVLLFDFVCVCRFQFVYLFNTHINFA